MTTEVIKRFESEEDFSRIYTLYISLENVQRKRARERERETVCVHNH